MKENEGQQEELLELEDAYRRLRRQLKAMK